MRFFIIHGSYGSPNENWFPWLKKKLESEGHEVIIPRFPTPKDQSLEDWMNVFNQYMDKIDSDTIFIGHSLGPSFILSILEKIPVKVKACFFVSGFLGLLNNPEFDDINRTFTTKDLNWKKIKENCEDFFLFHSNNDPYVPFENAKNLADNLETNIIEIKDAGHFNKASGYDEFEELSDYLKLYSQKKYRRVSLIIFYDETKRILLQDRKGISKFGEKWGYFGGVIEKGETPEEALVREVKEELAYEIKDYRFIGKISNMNHPGNIAIRYAYVSPLKNRLSEFNQMEGENMQMFSLEEAKEVKKVTGDDYVIKRLREIL